MNRDEAKNILLLYRTEADADDPQIAEALVLAKTDAELSRWFEAHRAAQNALREKFRQIEVPGGLLQQIISEQKAKAKAGMRRERITMAAAVVAILISIGVLAVFYLPHGSGGQNEPPELVTLANFENQAIGFARSGYAMNFSTNDLAQIQNYFVQNQSPTNYTLPAPLENATATGCAIITANAAPVSMICFATGKPRPKNWPGDLWLFVVNRSAIKDAPQNTSPQIATINGVTAAVWTQGDKLYLLGVQGDEQTLRKYL